MLERTLTTRLRAITGFTSDDISDPDLSEIIKAAVDEYQYYRPGLGLTAAADAITTVENQPNYTVPSDALWVIEVCWNPDQLGGDDEDGVLDNFYLQLTTETWDHNHPSELYVIYQRVAEYRRFFQGRWKIVNDEIWLIPMPEVSGQHVAVFYAKAKTLEDLAEVKDNPFIGLCKGYLQERRAGDMMGNSDWKAGSYAQGSTPALQMVKAAERTLEKYRAIIANPYYAERSGPGFGVRSA